MPKNETNDSAKVYVHEFNTNHKYFDIMKKNFSISKSKIFAYQISLRTYFIFLGWAESSRGRKRPALGYWDTRRITLHRGFIAI